MALINCPECKKQVSEQAKTCPNCGFQIERYFYQKAREAKQKEQQEALNKKIAEREKQKQIRIEKFKEHKIKYILISAVSMTLVVALIVGSILLYNKLQIKTFNSESEMKSYVEGVFVEEHNELLNYKITIKDDKIVYETYGAMKRYNETKKESYYVDLGKVENEYHISEYDYKNGKIITDRTTYYFKEGTGLSSTTKSNTCNTKDEFEVKINDEISDRNHTYKKIK